MVLVWTARMIRWILITWTITLSYAQSPAPTPPTIPASPTCSAPQRPVMVLIPKKKGASGQAFPGVTLSQCADICKSGKDPTGKDTPCAGFDYNAGSKTCNAFGTVDTASLADDPSTDFYQKVCVESNEICSSAMQFEIAPQKILIGFARQVVESPSPADCMKQCLDAYLTYGFECQSGMYYPTDKSCILNTETRYKRPDLFTDELQDQVLYFDNNCAGAVCASGFVVQYTKSMDLTPKDLEGHKVASVSLYSCQTLCTDNIGKPGEGSYNCKSFTYSAGDKTCTLFDDRILPLGRANFTATPGTDYFEKGCYKAQETCRNIPGFTRVPQMVLVGYAALVIDGVPSVSQCLDACMKPPDAFLQANAGFKCMSVMYYYGEQECILNSETRTTKPDLFIPEQSGYQEDYFDIMCLQGAETCPNGTVPTTFKIKDTMLVVANQTNVVKAAASGSEADCVKQCFELTPQKCRSFNYKGGSCDLLMVNGDTEVVQPSPGTDYYQLICLPTDSLGDCAKNPAAFEVSTAKINRVGGGGAGAGGPAPPARRRKARQAPAGTPPPTGAKKTLGDADTNISLPDCMVACLKDGCQGINYNILNGRCELFDQAGTLSDDPNTDFYKSTCAGATTGGGTPGIQTICNFDGMKIVFNKDSAFSGAIFAKMKYDTCRTEVKDATMAMLLLGFPNADSGCGGNSGNKCGGGGGGYGGGGQQPAASGGYGGGQQPAAGGSGYGSAQQTGGGCSSAGGCSGRLKRQSYGAQPPAPPPAPGGYGGGQQQQQGQQQENKKPAIFGPPTLPPRDCGVIDLRNGTYKATIVVQTNNLGIPGLVTSMDAIYEVSCDYSAFLARKVDAKSDLHVEGPTPALIQPRGKVDLSSPVMMQLMGSGGTPILQAKLGDLLELRWEMMALDDTMDFFVKECTAERGGPVPNSGGLGCSSPGGCGGGQQNGGGGGSGCSTPGGCGGGQQSSGGYGGGGAQPQPSGGGGYGGGGSQPQPSGGYGGGGGGQGSGGCNGGGCSLSNGKRAKRQGYGNPSPPAPSGGYGGNPSPPAPSGGYGGNPSPPAPGGYGGGNNAGSGCNKPGGCQLSGGQGGDSSGGCGAGGCQLSGGGNSGGSGGCGAGGCGSGGQGGGGGGGYGGAPAQQKSGGCGPGGCQLVGGKPGQDPNKLKLIEKGCPTPAVAEKLMPAPVKKESNKIKTAQLQAFRFDGSRSVRIICQLDICKGKCNPTTCPIGGSNQESWGKKKRETPKDHFLFDNQIHGDLDPEEAMHYETEHYRLPKRSHTISSFVILDPIEDQNLASLSSSQNRAVQNVSEHAYQDVEIESMKRGKICLPKSTFLSTFLFLGSLTLVQVIAITICLAKRFSVEKKSS